MLSRTIAVPTLLAASVAVPYVATNAPTWRDQLSGAPAAPPPTAASPAAPVVGAPVALPPLKGPGSALFPMHLPIEGAPAFSLAEVLRMDVTKEWVYQRWPRKTTALADLDLFGVRVPLVTGSQLHDLAGSLTYYFGLDGRVQRISFRGRTGDTTQLVALVTQRYGLTPQSVLAVGEQSFELRRGADVISRLYTRPAPVLWASSPHESFSVELDLQDPATARPLSLPAVPLPPPKPDAAAAPTAAAADVKEGEAAKTGKSPAARWEALFPRRRVPQGQIPNLNHDSIYQ